MTVSCHPALLNRLPADFVASLEAGTEVLPPAFFSLRRLRPVTMRPEPEQKGVLLELARSLIRGDGGPALRGYPRATIDADRRTPSNDGDTVDPILIPLSGRIRNQLNFLLQLIMFRHPITLPFLKAERR